MAKEILIADSDVAGQEEFKRIFDTAGYHLTFSENGEDALFRVRLFKPDLIFATMTLGEKTGLEFCETLKSNPQFKDIPFVLLTEIFEDISEEDRRRVQLDGVLSKPFERSEILDLADQLVLKGETGVDVEVRAEDEEEIIDLFEVVEEPEPKMSIDDLIVMDTKITSLEPPERLPEGKPLWEEKPEEERLFFPEETEMKKKEPELPPEKEGSPEDRLLEEIELEEILEKVERLKPTVEEEEKPAGKAVSGELKPPSLSEKLPEGLMNLEEFETDLKTPVMVEAQEADLKEFLSEERREEGPPEIPPKEMTLEEELTLFEESFEELKTQPATETAPPQKAAETRVAEDLILFEEPLEELKGQPEIQTAPTERSVETAVAEELFLFEEPLEESKAQPETETLPPERAAEIGIEEEELSELSEEEFPEALLEEVLKDEEIGFVGMRKEKEIGTVEEAKASVVPKEAMGPLVRVVDRKIEDVITKGLQDMMEDFITKVVPEMAQNVIVLTVERIEKMVKEMVPELTEKAIQEEIKRLQKGEKD